LLATLNQGQQLKGEQMSRRTKSNVIMNQEVADLVPVEKNTTTSVRFREVQFRSQAEKIAKDQLFYKNYYYPGGRQAFPDKPILQTVDKYFPYAEGGPLFIDEPLRTDDAKLFETKTEIMKKLGHRYVALTPGLSELDILERLA